MLNPFGQEAIRTHRLQRVVADRLARAGHDVLRFDWYGTGDSPGDDIATDLSDWVADVIAAHGVLLELCQEHRKRAAQPDPGRAPRADDVAASIAWVGIRLGATVALQAAAQIARPPQQLVLWDPILDGPAHLTALVCDHQHALHTGYSLPAGARRALAEFNATEPAELNGFAVSPRLLEQIAGIDMPVPDAPVARITWLTNTKRPGAFAAADAVVGDATSGAGARPPTTLETIALDIDFDWSSEEALNSALVPAPAVAAILRALGHV